MQMHLIRILSFLGLVPFPSVLTTKQRRGKFYFIYCVYALSVHLIFVLFGLIQYRYPPPLLLSKLPDNTSTFVLLTGYFQWKFILFTISIHSVIHMDKLQLFFEIIHRIDFKFDEMPIKLGVVMLICLIVIATRVIDMFVHHSISWESLCLRFVDVIEGIMFDVYIFHLLIQILIVQVCVTKMKDSLKVVLCTIKPKQIVNNLHKYNILFKLLQTFNDYYGLFMAHMCIIAFLRCSLAMYFVLISLNQFSFCFDPSITILCFAVWNTSFISYIFYTLHVTSTQVS